jgi:carbonic anhydrase/acetyltransferase-like protein (isoleucine patch superfamily)
VIEHYKDFLPAIDEGAWVHTTAYIGGEVTLARGASIWPMAVLRGDQGAIRIGEDSNVQDGTVCHATGGQSEVVVGARVTIGHRAVIHGCIIEDDCLIGMGAVVMDNAVIGAGSMVGAGAVVLANTKVAPGSLVLGSPAKAVRPVKPAHTAWIEHSWRTYARLRDEHSGIR